MSVQNGTSDFRQEVAEGEEKEGEASSWEGEESNGEEYCKRGGREEKHGGEEGIVDLKEKRKHKIEFKKNEGESWENVVNIKIIQSFFQQNKKEEETLPGDETKSRLKIHGSC